MLRCSIGGADQKGLNGMVLIRTAMLLCSLAFFTALCLAGPAAAKPVRAAEAGARVARLELTDVSARRRAHVQRKQAYARRKPARTARMSHVRGARGAHVRNARVSQGRSMSAPAAGDTSAGGLVAEARRWLGGNPTGR